MNRTIYKNIFKNYKSKTGRRVYVKSRLGKKILRNYIFVLSGGAAVASSEATTSGATEIASARGWKSTIPPGGKTVTTDLLVRSLLLVAKNGSDGGPPVIQVIYRSHNC